MMDDKPNILLFYEELVKQFGYIVLFSGIFPLAALLSFISNSIQVRSQINNLSYVRRFRAEPSFGIGNWFSCLESLSFASIIINCYATYATSNVYSRILVIKKEVTITASAKSVVRLLAKDLIELIANILKVEHIIAALAEDDEYIYRGFVALVTKCVLDQLPVGVITIHYFNWNGLY